MANCPYCEYEGECRSVEAHVSSKTDEAHRGKTGIECREEIEASESDVETATLPVKLDAAESEDLEPESDEGTSEEASVEPVSETGHSGGSVSSGWALVGATVVLILTVVFIGGSAEVATEEPDETEDEQGDLGDGWDV